MFVKLVQINAIEVTCHGCDFEGNAQGIYVNDIPWCHIYRKPLLDFNTLPEDFPLTINRLPECIEEDNEAD
jgi:hypothetical protein